MFCYEAEGALLFGATKGLRFSPELDDIVSSLSSRGHHKLGLDAPTSPVAYGDLKVVASSG